MAEEFIPPTRPIVTRSEAKSLGSTRYFTGNPCPSGHIDERTVSSKTCLECGRVAANARYEKNPEARKEYGKRYRAENYDKVRLGIREWQSRNPEKVKEYSRLWIRNWRAENPAEAKDRQSSYYAANKEKVNLRARAWARNNPDKVRIRDRKWAVNNPERRRAYVATRRARRISAGGSYTAQDVAWLRVIQKSRCAHLWCRKPLKSGYHVDHIIPLALGGSNGKRNLQLLCPPCNCRKGAADPIDHAQKHGFLV